MSIQQSAQNISYNSNCINDRVQHHHNGVFLDNIGYFHREQHAVVGVHRDIVVVVRDIDTIGEGRPGIPSSGSTILARSVGCTAPYFSEGSRILRILISKGESD